jgi:hypothetical protein
MASMSGKTSTIATTATFMVPPSWVYGECYGDRGKGEQWMPSKKQGSKKKGKVKRKN